MRQLCPPLYNVCREIVPFLDGSEEGLLSVAGGAVRYLEGVGCGLLDANLIGREPGPGLRMFSGKFFSL